MKDKPSAESGSGHPKTIEVTRDKRLDDGKGPAMPAPDGAAMRDEDYTDRDKPLLPGSAEAKRLQKRPPQGKGQLGVGTAGDAARPSKEGIYGKPIPPRGEL